MANIQERRDKSGKLISYSVRVFRGRDADGKQLKPWTATFDVIPTWTEKSARSSCYGNTGLGKAPSGCAWGNTTRIKALCSPRTVGSPCTRTV